MWELLRRVLSFLFASHFLLPSLHLIAPVPPPLAAPPNPAYEVPNVTAGGMGGASNVIDIDDDELSEDEMPDPRNFEQPRPSGLDL